MSGNTFAVPVDSTEPAPIFPGEAYEFIISAAPGAKLSLATMFVQSNDLFFAPDEEGIELFDADGMPISGDITSQVLLWDAGTELNEQPGAGENQAPRQSGPNMGDMDPDSTVRIVNDGFSYPADTSVIRVSISTDISTSVNPFIEEGLLDLTAFPNPISEATTVRFSLERSMNVGISLYDLMGKEVNIIKSETPYTPGTHEVSWNTNQTLSSIPGGIYILRLTTNQKGLGNILVTKQ